MIKANIGETKQGQIIISLLEGSEKDFMEHRTVKLLLKAYPNEQGNKIRIVIPSLKSFKQARIDIDSHYIEVEL